MSDSVHIPADLFEHIMQRIDIEATKRTLRRRLIAAVVFSAVVLGFFVNFSQKLGLEISQSGMGQYLSLARSDFYEVAANWQDFSIGVLESFPMVSLIEFLISIFVLLIAARFVLTYRDEMASLNTLRPS